MSDPEFIHLHVHSDLSIIDGLSKVDTLVKRAASLHMPALAITDFTNIFGCIKFYKAACCLGIKPIIGVDFLVTHDIYPSELSELTCLAANNNGYHNLMLLISLAYQRRSVNCNPTIKHDWLIDHNDGLIILSGGCKGDIGKCLLRGDIVEVERYLSFYERYFSDRYYLEIVRTNRKNEEIYVNAAVDLSFRKNIPLVASNDVRFMYKSDYNAHEVRVAIHNNYLLNDPKRPSYYSDEQFMRSQQEMYHLFMDLPEALINSVEIARRCNVTMNFGKIFLPKFPTGDSSTKKFFITSAKKGLNDRLELLFPNIDERSIKRKKYDIRLNDELKVINKMGFPGYFLIVMEFIQWAKNNKISVGPGRGSGTGSLVAYALKITDINPLDFNLLFERFLNPDRISMPDLDIDFCMEKRDLVIDHVIKIYGQEAVSQIIAFGTMTAKAVIRDVGRVLGYQYSFVDRISKLVPLDPGMTLDRAFVIEPYLKYLHDSSAEIQSLIRIARQLEGVVRNVGKHAGGVVIAPNKITDFSPLYFDDDDNKHSITHFDKNDIEAIGLVKFDFLGLRTLTIIRWSLDMINNNYFINQGKTLLDITSISLSDRESFAVLQNAETTAVFQLESNGMKELIKRLKPDCFEDIVALLALFRPGPLQSGMVDNFINRKHGREPIFYPDKNWQHESLIPILRSTYGIILYQEQVMQIAQVLAGYTLGSADILRRAIGKKNIQEMSKQRSIFKEGAKKQGINSELSMRIFDLLEKFANYGFNRSHSVAYAFISYQTLWLKTHYSAEFMAAVLNADIENTEKIMWLIYECRRMKLVVKPPNINISRYYFYVNEKKEIIYGLGAIKGVGKGSVEEILKARNMYGYFNNLFDLCLYTKLKKINRRVLEKLIKSGSCDVLGQHRAELIFYLNKVMQIASQYVTTTDSIQGDMFTDLFYNQSKIFIDKNIQLWSKRMVLENEKDALGFYLTDHPVNQYLDYVKSNNNIIRLKDISTKYDDHILVIGLIVSVRIVSNKKGNHVALFILDDYTDRLNVVLFTDLLKQYQSLLEKGQVVIVRGKVNISVFDNSLKMIAYELIDVRTNK